ncbi:hypothetical protein DPEC_G00259820 [Dallia pectoralis]|uniref:Uncharacterized protein n=1 Tax=Dallia pectoralis TaxID=75939 RepID=A0ACC2FRI8_DALPE|nr:hypothetical protein DPEC_G00259820 [Dallia pectoralis]
MSAVLPFSVLPPLPHTGAIYISGESNSQLKRSSTDARPSGAATLSTWALCVKVAPWTGTLSSHELIPLQTRHPGEDDSCVPSRDRPFWGYSGRPQGV